LAAVVVRLITLRRRLLISVLCRSILSISLTFAGDKRRSWAERNHHRNWALDMNHIREAEPTRRDSAEVGSSSSPSPCRQSSPVPQLPSPPQRSSPRCCRHPPIAGVVVDRVHGLVVHLLFGLFLVFLEGIGLIVTRLLLGRLVLVVGVVVFAGIFMLRTGAR
jgi:hypothetical protein